MDGGSDAGVLGVDLSESQLRRARARLPGPNDNLRFLQYDAMELASLEEDPFDAAVCLDAACYFPDKAHVLRGIASRLRPGARLLLVDWCRADYMSALQEELILEPFCRYWGIPGLETLRGYERAFRAAGFHLVAAEDLSERVHPN